MFHAATPRPSVDLASILAAPRSAQVEDPKLVRIARYWRDRSVDGRLPSRRDIDPIGLRDLLPFVFLVDVEPEPRRFRYRLIGTAIAEFTGRDLTGRVIDESTYGAFAGLAQGVFSIPVDTAKPVLCRGRAVYNPPLAWQRVELLILPLSRDGNAINMLLGGYTTVRVPAAGETGGPPEIQFLEVIPDPILSDEA